MEEYDFLDNYEGLYVHDGWADPKNRYVFKIGELYAYIKEQRAKGRDPKDITLEEIEPFIIERPEE